MKITLRTQYSLIITILILSIVSVLAGLMLSRSNSAMLDLTETSSRTMSDGLMKQIRERGQFITSLVAKNLANPLYHLDLYDIRQQLVTVQSQEDVIYAHVYDAEGKILHDGTRDVASYGRQIDDDTIREAVRHQDRLVMKVEGDALCVSVPIWIGEIPLGGVSIGFSLDELHKQTGFMAERLDSLGRISRQEHIRVLLVATGLLVLFGLLMSVVVTGRLLKPIRELVQYTEQMGRGEFGFRITARYNNEIGELISSFDRMRRDLQETTVSVGELEKQVALRTMDLQDMNTDLSREIHKREKAQERLREYQNRLEELVHERTTELVGSNNQLLREIEDRKRAEVARREAEKQLERAHKMEAIGRLAAGVAHDLNNILSGIVSYPDLLLLELPEDSPMRKSVSIMQRSGKRAAAIVQDLLALARRAVAVEEIVNLTKVVEEYLDSPECHKLLEFHTDVRIRTDFAEDILNIKGSPVHLSKTVMNLVSNAAEAMPLGGTVTITLHNQYVDRPIRGYDAVVEGDYVVLTIADVGTGISPGDIEHIFEPFYTKKVMGRSGTGLGMAVVWGTVKDHGGYIDVESRLGQGSTFTLYFPVTREDIREKPARVSLDELMGHGERILVIDDVHDQRAIASSLLTKLGYSVSAVSSGEKAVEYLKHHHADLLLLDMIMDPGMNGLETYRRITSMRPGQKALIASGFSASKDVKEALRLGAGAYIRKPYTLEKIGIEVMNELNRASGI